VTRRIEIRILADGTIAAEVSGAPGASCLDSLPTLTSILDAEIDDSKPTPEFSRSAATAHSDVDDLTVRQEQR
jgi:hypothetical protein